MKEGEFSYLSFTGSEKASHFVVWNTAGVQENALHNFKKNIAAHPLSPQIKVSLTDYEIYNQLVQKSKQHRVLVNSFHLNGHTLAFDQQT